MGRTCTVSTHERAFLSDFAVFSCAPGAYSSPAEAAPAFATALSISGPATVARALAEAKRLDLGAPPDLDAVEHWFRTRLPPGLPEGAHALCFDGLATIADAWLDGEHVLHSENMFRSYEVNAPAVHAGAELILRFSSLGKHLAQKRTRPRWRTRLVDAQQLRWARTSLLGRAPGMGPRLPVVGPFRDVWVETRRGVRVTGASLVPRLVQGHGELTIDLSLTALPGSAPPARARVCVRGEAAQAELLLEAHQRGQEARFAGTLRIPQVRPWWPHTHGSQPRSRVTVELDSGAVVDLGQVGFRALEVKRGPRGEDFELHVNGERVFCRGACWTADDLLAPASGAPRATLEWMRRAGMNMVRVGGTTCYESDAFYELCDELGIMVFQDFMFANMDYPSGDAAFVGEVRAEVRELLGRLSHRPCLAILCGNSEVELAAAATGVARETWESPLFYQVIPALVRELAPDVPYVHSSATGGALPFHVNVGTSHYYGVGAYLRPLDDARRAHVRFAAECLGFANVPRRETIEAFLGDLDMPTHHPRWKERVPRDRGAGWDFDDVCEHYVRLLFGAEAARVRYTDPEHYLDLSRAAVCTAMESTFSEFRCASSSTGGALVWTLKDLVPGAGWGVIDAHGLPKAAYHALARVCAPVALLATDEGLNGVVLHAINERDVGLDASLKVWLYRAGEVLVDRAERTLELGPRSTLPLAVDGMLERFVDSSYSHRFGPPQYDLLVARLESQGKVLARVFFEPLGGARVRELDLGLKGHLERREGRTYAVVSSRRFAQRVSIEVDGHVPSDDFFHLAPGEERAVELLPRDNVTGAARGRVSALNMHGASTLVFTDSQP